MSNPLQLIGTMFSSEARDRRSLNRLQSKLTATFVGTEPLRKDFQRAQEKSTKASDELAAFRDKNANLELGTVNVANKLAQRRLMSRKWFAIVIGAILGIGAVKLFFEETLNIRLEWLPAVFVGCILGYLVLAVAIHLRYDGNQPNEDGKVPILPRLYFLFPLMLVPVLNGFNIWAHPENPANYLLGFFLVFSFVFEIMVTGYANQYVLMQQTKEARRIIERLQKNNEATIESLDQIAGEMQKIRMTITNLATEFHLIYQAIVARGETPTIIIPLPYRFVLNRRVWHTDVLPIPQIQITEPSGAVAEYSRFWDAATTVDIPTDHLLEGHQATPGDSGNQKRQANKGSKDTNPIQEPSDAPVGGTGTLDPNDEKSTQTAGSPAPDFGRVLSDHEKYV